MKIWWHFFFQNFWRTWVLFVGPLIPLFWTSGDIYPGFQSQVGSLACMLPCLCTTDSWDSPLVQHLLTSWWPAWQPVVFSTCYICSRGRMLGFDRETSRIISRRAIHSATATGLVTLDSLDFGHKWRRPQRRGSNYYFILLSKNT